MGKKVSELSSQELKNKSVGELYSEVKLLPELLSEIKNTGKEKFERFIKDKYKIEEEIEKNKNKSEVDSEKTKELLKECYYNIKDILKKYLDWEEDKYTIVSLWIIGTYFHNSFPTYPYLYLNAMKGSGKTRALNIITSLSMDGSLLNSLTEAVLFRTKGTLGIDEFEGVERKGKESLKELLNSAYKRGASVKRMKKIKTFAGEEQVVEQFDVYRPIVMANISGMENVLEDRCISLVIEKSFKSSVTNLIEIFKEEIGFKKTKELLNQCRLCRCRYAVECIEVYKRWNDYVTSNNTNNTNNTNYTNDTNDTFPFINLKLEELGGRYLELSFPLILLAGEISEELQNETTLILKSIFEIRKEDDVTENLDISLIDFVSQEVENNQLIFIPVNEILRRFKEFTQNDEDWLNIRWLGKALKRLNLIIEKRRKSYGREIRLNIKKSQEMIKKFRK